MDGENRLRDWSLVSMAVRVPIERISGTNGGQRAAYDVTNQVMMLAGEDWHVFFADLEQRITIAIAVFIPHRHTVLADFFNVHANAVVPLVFAGKSRVPAILRINGHRASEAAPVVRRRVDYDKLFP